MTKTDLLKNLQNAISEDEYHHLSDGTVPHISEFNRQTILEMMDRTAVSEETVPTQQVAALENILENFLGIYMADHKESWKWIIVSCIYLSFICARPLHPQEIVNYVTAEESGVTVYFCPCKSSDGNTSCDFCVCKPMQPSA